MTEANDVNADQASLPRVVVTGAAALDTSGIIMTGLDAHDVVTAVSVAMANRSAEHRVSAVIPHDYLIDNTSLRAVNFILSTARRHAGWAGLRR